MGFKKYFSLLLFLFVVFFSLEYAFANITRSCTAKYNIYIEAPDAIRGNNFDTPDFSGRGGCGAVVPNRCRDRASEKLIACFRAQLSNINAVPAECTSAHNVRSYPISGSLVGYLRENVCRRYPGHSEITVRVNPSIRGNRHCDCNPWSNRVLDCTGSGPIQVTCLQVYHIVPGALEGLQVQPTQEADTTAPTVRITSPTTSPTYSTESTPITLRGNASDAVGVTQVTWANSRGGSSTCTGTTNWTCNNINLSSGMNNITVTARDAANNRGTDSIQVTYTPAPTPPDLTVRIVSPTEGQTINLTDPVHIEVEISDPDSAPTSCIDLDIEFRIMGRDWQDMRSIPRYCADTDPTGIDQRFTMAEWRIRAKLQTPGAEWTAWRNFTVSR